MWEEKGYPDLPSGQGQGRNLLHEGPLLVLQRAILKSLAPLDFGLPTIVRRRPWAASNLRDSPLIPIRHWAEHTNRQSG